MIDMIPNPQNPAMPTITWTLELPVPDQLAQAVLWFVTGMGYQVFLIYLLQL